MQHAAHCLAGGLQLQPPCQQASTAGLGWTGLASIEEVQILTKSAHDLAQYIVAAKHLFLWSQRHVRDNCPNDVGFSFSFSLPLFSLQQEHLCTVSFSFNRSVSLRMRVLFVLTAWFCLISLVSAADLLQLLAHTFRKAPAHRYNTASENKARRHFELPPPQVLHALRIEEASPQLHELVSQVAVDLLPFEHGITLAMVEQASHILLSCALYIAYQRAGIACYLQAYCTGRLPGMRIQIIDQQVYVVGRPDSVHFRCMRLSKAGSVSLLASAYKRAHFLSRGLISQDSAVASIEHRVYVCFRSVRC